jgi:hypothetical protein
MNRRAILAGLLAVGLIVMVVVLASSGGDGQGTEITQGKPFTGSSSVTRSIASIAASQRYLDRHPEIERRAERQAAAEEAAREQAGEAEQGDEGEAEQGEEGAEQSGEGEAAGGEEEAGGERPLAAAPGDVPLETDIREKPEPGEETGPSRQAGQPAPQPRIGKAAIGPKSSFSEGTSFLGADSNDSGFIPPDSMGAVGPTQVLVSVNGRLRLFDKQGNPDPNLDVTDSAFWDSLLPPGVEPTDPGVEYDRLSERWIVSAIDTQNTDNQVMLAVSDGPTITDETSFEFFAFDESDPLPQPAPARFADYPQLGVDNNAIYVGVNEFTSSSGSFSGTNLYVIRKSSVLDGGSPPGFDVTGFRTVNGAAGQGPDSPQPATTADPDVAEGYVVGPDNQIANRIDVRRITDPGGTPAISSDLVVPIPATAQPLPVPALGTTGGLDALDDRFFEAMIAKGPDGSDSLWTAHNIRVNASGVGSSSGDRDAARWYQLGDLGSDPPTLTQSGTLFDTVVSNPRFFWMPSIAMNGQGHASLNTSTAGNGRRAEVGGTGRLASDPLGTTQAFDLIQSSNNGYNLGASAPRRWGDYSQTVVDPTDNQTFWTFQEYTSEQNVWGVRVIQLKAPPPAVPADASPDTVPIDTDPHPVQITGIPTGGAGFFDTTDPGPPYPDYEHISATVSNNVIVNDVTVTDPTHLTLDLDTSAATPGVASVTITNPDGQSTSCSHALIIGSDATPAATPNPQGTSPPSPANNNTPTVFGSGADCGSDVSIYADDPTCMTTPVMSGSATAFASPGIPVSVADDSSTDFYAQATSVANVPSACSPTPVTYVEDSAPPQVSVDSGPTGSIPDQTPTFTFSGSDAIGPVTFRCSIDTGTPNFRACSGPGDSDTPAIPLADGSYTFRVQASDTVGNSSVATRSFSVQIPNPPPAPSPPETTITKGPKKTQKTRPKFKFTSSDPSAAFQCKLDKGKFAPCASPFKTPKLRPGKHKLQVRAVGAGGTDPTPAVRKFRILPPV